MRIALATAALLLALTGCGDGFVAAQNADTIEAYEAYLAANPSGRFLLEANSRLESLYLEKANQEKKLEAFDAYLERFPDGDLKARALEDREEFLFAWARAEHTGAAWERYLEEYPRAKKPRKKHAKRMIKVFSYHDHLEVGEPRFKQINLAEDPEGPLNGWQFDVDVANNGDKTIESMSLTIDYLAENGAVIQSREWPLVAPYWKVPIEEERKVPMKPGETRTWEWSSGDLPERWAKDVRVYVTRIAFVGEGEADK